MSIFKKNNYINICEGISLVNPSHSQQDKIFKEMQRLSGSENIDYDSLDVNYYLFKELLVTENGLEDIDINEFNESLESPSEIMTKIIYELGLITSEMILNNLRKSVLELKIAEMEILKKEALETIDNLTEISKNLGKKKTLKQIENRVKELDAEMKK